MKSFLGVASVGAGLALMAAPRQVARSFGLPQHPLLARGLGARDVAIGSSLLRRDRRSGLLARALSDALDFGLIWREGQRHADSLRATPRLMVALLSAGLASGLWLSAPARRRRWLPELLHQQPALALGGAFLLGVTAARGLRRPMPQAQPALPSPVRAAEPSAWHAEPSARPAPDPIGVGSPIGDSPYAGGSRG